jgi:hypothetical protein
VCGDCGDLSPAAFVCAYINIYIRPHGDWQVYMCLQLSMELSTHAETASCSLQCSCTISFSAYERASARACFGAPAAAPAGHILHIRLFTWHNAVSVCTGMAGDITGQLALFITSYTVY